MHICDHSPQKSTEVGIEYWRECYLHCYNQHFQVKSVLIMRKIRCFPILIIAEIQYYSFGSDGKCNDDSILQGRLPCCFVMDRHILGL